MKIKFTLNKKVIETKIEPGQTLLEYLRKNGIYSVKRGCDNGECGACTILIEGKSFNACLVLMHSVDGKSIETIESFGYNNRLQKLQDNFLDQGAVQCGYCTPGMLLSIEALFKENDNPSETEIRQAIAGNLCRCTGYVKPIKASQK